MWPGEHRRRQGATVCAQPHRQGTEAGIPFRGGPKGPKRVLDVPPGQPSAAARVVGTFGDRAVQLFRITVR
jgi:hypothetical protein